MFLKYYRLDEQPFGVTPDPRFLYMGPTHQEAFSSLLYGIETGRGFMALIAGPGLGKTTTLMALMQRLESARTAFLFQAHSDPSDFLRSLLIDLGVQPSGQNLGDLHRQLREILMQEARTGKRIVVVIDEAQNLEVGILEMVRMLSNFETAQAKLLQILLVGQPQLADVLASPRMEQLRQRVSVVTHFSPLSRSEVPNYIDHRLRVAGYEGGRLFTPGALGLIADQSKGIPRNINNLCFQAMSLGYAKQQKKIDEAVLREVIADLSLETLGTAPAPAAHKPEEPVKTAARAPASELMAAGKASKSKVERDDSPLDAVELSSGLVAAATQRSANVRSRHAVPAFALVGLLMIVAWLCMGTRLRSDIYVIRQLAGRMGLSPRTANAATTAASQEQGVSQAAAPQAASSNSQAAPVLQLAPNPAAPAPAETEAPPQGGQAPGVDSQVEPAQIFEPSELPADRMLPTPAQRSDEGAPGSARLVVESSVDGAKIAINGKSNPQWVTPHLFSLPAGPYEVSVARGGYLPWTRRVQVDDGQERWLMAQLASQDSQDGGVFTVETDPPGMQVFIDGKPFGPSRVETVLPPGWHSCEVVPGWGLHPLDSKFHLQPGQALTRVIRVKLPEHPSGAGDQRRGSSGR